MRILNLTLKKKWFDLISSGKKTDEYREYKPYWVSRLLDKKYDAILFRNGYNKTSPNILIKYYGYGILDTDGSIGDCGEELNGKYFVLNLGKILSKNAL